MDPTLVAFVLKGAKKVHLGKLLSLCYDNHGECDPGYMHWPAGENHFKTVFSFKTPKDAAVPVNWAMEQGINIFINIPLREALPQEVAV